MHKFRLARRSGFRYGSPSWWVVVVATLVGLIAFLYPFFLPAIEPAPENRARAGDAPLLFALVTLLCLLAIVVELDPARSGAFSASKIVALLGVLVASDAALRLIPTFLGASPLFALIILTGAAFGPALGFQMGTLALLVSAFITGGVGPWLPFQMLGAGWIGLFAGLLPLPNNERRRLLILAAYGAVTGFAYGALLNLWSWPFTAPGLDQDIGLYWSPALSVQESLGHYARFYVVTSLWYDAFRAAANVVLILFLGGPILRTLHRSYARFSWQPWSAREAPEA
jgi:energy-coupling factor transport system substrate-specific component